MSVQALLYEGQQLERMAHIADGTFSQGNITTQNLVPAGVATANSAVEIDVNSLSTLAIQVTGTYTGALSLQATIDGLVWVTLGGLPLLNVNTGGYLASITSALQSVFQADVSGFARARITGLAAMTGTAAVTLQANPTTGMVALDAPLPAGSAAIGTVTVTQPAPSAISLTAAATTNATSSKATAGSLFEISADNETAAIKYLKLYNKATAPTVGTDVPVLTVPIPANGFVALEFGANGKRFTTGIAFALTGAQAVADTTALAAGDVHVHGSYV